MSTLSGSGTPAGWYPDAEHPGQQRYWDGTSWTEHRAPATSEAPASAPASPASAQASAPGAKPLWKRWWVWAIAVVLLIAGISAVSGGGSKDPSASTGTPSASPSPSITPSDTPSPSPTPEASSPPATTPRTDAQAAFNETFGTFAPIAKAGKSDSVIKLPAGVTAGVVTMAFKGSGNFAVTVLDAANQSTGDLLANEIGSWSGVAPFGLQSFGGEPAKLKVQGSGTWSIKIAPISSAPEITFPAAVKGSRVFMYLGDASDWTIAHKGKSNFSVLTTGTDGSGDLLVNEIGNYAGTVPASAGPVLITVGADGAWTIKAA